MSQVYYVAGNTAEGWVNSVKSNLTDIKNVYILKHDSNKLRTAIFKGLLNKSEDKQNIEIILSDLGEDYLDGFIQRKKSIAFLSNRIAFDEMEKATIIDLTTFVSELPRDYQVLDSINRFKEHRQQAYDCFATALKIHDELESIYINEMNFKQANRIAKELIETLFAHIPQKGEKSVIYRRLFGTNTPEGAVNKVPKILADLDIVYFIKGRAGTGKSTLMKKVLARCLDIGLDVELYYCSFDPNSIDMILVRELSFCLFDSTQPHEFFPEKEGHHLIDMYSETVTPGTDEKYVEKITQVTSRYKHDMSKGLEQLQNADKALQENEERYMINNHELKKIISHICSQIV